MVELLAITDWLAPTLVAEWRVALGVTWLLAPIAYKMGFVSKNGMIGGIVVGSLISLGMGLAGFLLLFTFFFLGSLFSKWKIAEKKEIGIAQEDEGKRGAKHAIAKGGVPVLMSIWACFAPHEWINLIFAGALATALSDTTSSELGSLYGKHPINPLTFKPVPVGTEGAVSLEGTLLGIIASAFLGWIAALVGLLSYQSILAIIGGAFIGTTLESFIGSYFPKINNELINFVNTFIGGVATVICFIIWQQLT